VTETVEPGRLNGASPRDPTAAKRARRYRGRKATKARRSVSVTRVSPTTLTSDAAPTAGTVTNVVPSRLIIKSGSSVTVAALVYPDSSALSA
jgi:hypothetical protein